MPRNELNNPTRRILRLLDDADELEAAYDEMAQALLELSPQAFERLSPRPALTFFTAERTRQELMGRRSDANRDSMRRARLRSRPARLTTSAIVRQIETSLEAEQREIMRRQATTFNEPPPRPTFITKDKLAGIEPHQCKRCTRMTLKVHCVDCERELEAEAIGGVLNTTPHQPDEGS